MITNLRGVERGVIGSPRRNIPTFANGLHVWYTYIGTYLFGKHFDAFGQLCVSHGYTEVGLSRSAHRSQGETRFIPTASTVPKIPPRMLVSGYYNR